MDIGHRAIPPLEIIEEALTGRFKVHGDPRTVDCIVGFSFGYRGKPGKAIPGLSNQDLAAVALMRYSGVPKIFQFEISDAYITAGGKKKEIALRIAQHRLPDTYLDTREVGVQAKLFMDQKKWKTALILAHPNHMPRANAVCRALGMQTVVTAEVKGAVEFDPLSTQKWTRDIGAWRSYEPEAIEFYRLKGWV